MATYRDGVTSAVTTLSCKAMCNGKGAVLFTYDGTRGWPTFMGVLVQEQSNANISLAQNLVVFHWPSSMLQVRWRMENECSWKKSTSVNSRSLSGYCVWKSIGFSLCDMTLLGGVCLGRTRCCSCSAKSGTSDHVPVAATLGEHYTCCWGREFSA